MFDCGLFTRPAAQSATTQVFKRGSRSDEATTAQLESGEMHRASQTLLSKVSAGALLAVVPDPVTCFKNSSFRQVGVLPAP